MDRYDIKTAYTYLHICTNIFICTYIRRCNVDLEQKIYQDR